MRNLDDLFYDETRWSFITFLVSCFLVANLCWNYYRQSHHTGTIPLLVVISVSVVLSCVLYGLLHLKDSPIAKIFHERKGDNK